MHAKPSISFALGIYTTPCDFRSYRRSHPWAPRPPVLKFPGTHIFQHVALIAGSWCNRLVNNKFIDNSEKRLSVPVTPAHFRRPSEISIPLSVETSPDWSCKLQPRADANPHLRGRSWIIQENGTEAYRPLRLLIILLSVLIYYLTE